MNLKDKIAVVTGAGGGIGRAICQRLAKDGAKVAVTKALAMELAAYNVTVNCVPPGMISRSAHTEASDGTYIGRTGSQKEVAALVSFLASEEADFITGVNYTIDGGRVLGPKSGGTPK